jgi:DNA-binding response OmpR family regulator
MVTTAVDTRGNILIVDDEENLRKILFRKLTKEGYTCNEASNAKEALQRLGKYTIDLVILDIKMPGKSGTDLYRGYHGNGCHGKLNDYRLYERWSL